jgi:hypothetical protein
MPSSINFGKFVLFVSLCSLVGCGTTRYQMTAEDLSNFKVDCSRVEEQVAFLNGLRTTREEQFGAKFQIRTFGPFTADYQARRDTANGLNNWWINTNLREIYKRCATPF